MGGFVQAFANPDVTDETEDNVIIHIRNAGEKSVNGTYRRHHGEMNRYTSMGRYDGRDVEFFIELREVNGNKMWFLSCDTGGNPNEPAIDFYKVKVNERCAYPARVRWESAAIRGTFPAPKSSVSHFGKEVV